MWVIGILILHYAALFLIPVPGYGAGDLSQQGNLVGWFDRNFLPGRLAYFNGTYDETAYLLNSQRYVFVCWDLSPVIFYNLHKKKVRSLNCSYFRESLG
jgi:hypothetical protein